MSLPWLKEDYKRPVITPNHSRSRSRSNSKTRRSKGDDAGRPSVSRKSNSRSRSRSRSGSRGRSRRGRGSFHNGRRGRGGGPRLTARSKERSGAKRRHRSNSSSSGSSESSGTPTRLVASERPKYVKTRIFVANIISREVGKQQLTDHFEKYGNIVDVLIHPKNYAFIQYLKEEHAKLAVEGENGSMFNGSRIDVKLASENRKGGGGGQSGRGGRGGGRGGAKNSELMRDSYAPEPFMHGPGRIPPPFPMGGEFGMRDPYFPDPYRRGYPPDPWLPPEDPFRRDPYAEPYRDSYAPRAPPPPNECVVFYVNNQLLSYAESIERQVKDQSIIAITSIIPEGRTAPQMLDELSSRGGLFAIFVNAQNEAHRSLTLNIIHGTPQEHRNMPLNDAISLIGRSFEKYVEELRAKTNASAAAPTPAANPSPVVAAAAARAFLPPSSEIIYLLNLLADNRAVTVQELDQVIKYLQERKDKLLDVEKRPIISGGSVPPADKYPEEKSSDPSPGTGNARKSPPRDIVDRGYADRGSSERMYDDRMASERGPPADNSRYGERGPSEQRYGNKPQEQHVATDSSANNEKGPIHEELTKKILSIFSGGDQSLMSALSASSHSSAPAPAPAPAPQPAAPSSSSASLINFDNPNVQKALDNLIQSGPNLLKGITPKINSAPPVPDMSSGGSGSRRGYDQGRSQDSSAPPSSTQIESHSGGGMDMSQYPPGMYGMGHMPPSMHGYPSFMPPMPGYIMGQPPPGGYDMHGSGQGGYQGPPPLPHGAPPPPPPPQQRY